MSGGRKKYLIPIITSVVASVLLIAFCIVAIVGNTIRLRAAEKGSDETEYRTARTAVIHNSESDTDFFYKNDGVIHMSVEIPAVRMSLDSAAELILSLGNSQGGELPLPESVRLIVRYDYGVGGNEPFEIRTGKSELDNKHYYYGFSSSKYACRDCHGEEAKGGKLGCDFDFSEKLTLKYTDKQIGIRQGAIVFRVSGESSPRENGESAKWFGKVIVYFVADIRYIAFGNSAYTAAKIFYGGRLPGEMNCEG